MIPWATQDFDHLQARVLFKQNMLTLEWQTGTPMPDGLVDEVVKAVKLPSGATGGGATASHAQLAQQRLALEAEREAQAAQSAAVAQRLGEQERALAAQRVEMEAQAAALAQQAVGLEQQAAAAKMAGQVRFHAHYSSLLGTLISFLVHLTLYFGSFSVEYGTEAGAGA